MTDPWTTIGSDVAAPAAIGVLVVIAFVLGVLRRRRRTRQRQTAGTAPLAPAPQPAEAPASPAERLRRGLARTRSGLTRLAPLLSRTQLDARDLEDLEAALLAADVGVGTTQRLLERIRRRDDAPLRTRLADAMIEILEATCGTPPLEAKPRVIMVVGVNGVGKTTSVGKLAARYRASGARVLLVAGDTFRAAAIEQLAVWAERSSAELIRQQQGSDPGAVVYDGMRAAIARAADVVIIDTAGRLHTKSNLMDELRKVRRIIAREVPGAPHETLLVLDAVSGQNGLAQARAFVAELKADGVILTKLDGTAKGGVVVAIASELGIPIRYVGVGEGADDLRDFEPRQFVEALLTTDREPDSLDT
jgi:fused signal recognition particle receptor